MSRQCGASEHRISIYRMIVLGMICIVLTAGAWAQPSDTITANPKAVPLHQVWAVYGSGGGGDRVGDGVGSVSDVNGDSIAEIAVYYGAAGEWRIFYGGHDSISHTPAW